MISLKNGGKIVICKTRMQKVGLRSPYMRSCCAHTIFYALSSYKNEIIVSFIFSTSA